MIAIQPRTDPLRTPSGAVQVALLALTGGLAIAGSLAVALLNQPYFDLLNGFVGATEAVPRALLFSSWLVLIGGPLVVWQPARFGFTAGDIRRSWRAIVVVCLAAAAVTVAILRLTGRIPYSDASLFVESVLVPLTEELLFRGVLLALLLMAFGRLANRSVAVPLAIIVDGIGFGVAHLANATSLDIGFVAPQATFAVALGVACAWLAVRTRSVYPAMLLHGVVNTVVVSI
jgi:membrane protease YdiL (CAAX protease family)